MLLPQPTEPTMRLSWRAKRRAAREASERREAEAFSERMRAMSPAQSMPREGLIVGVLGTLLLKELSRRLQIILDVLSAQRAQAHENTQAVLKLALETMRREATAQHRLQTQHVAQAVAMGVREGLMVQARRAHAREQWLAVEALAARRLAEGLIDASSPIPKAALPGMLALHKLLVLVDAKGTNADPIEAWLAGDPSLAARMVAELDAAVSELQALEMLEEGYNWRIDAGPLAARLEAEKDLPVQALH